MNPPDVFDGLFRFSQAKQNLTIREVAEALGVAAQHVRDYLDEALLVGACINDAPNAQRQHMRIARFSVVALWRERIAQGGNPEPPFYQSNEVIWWRNELRKRKGLSSIQQNSPGASLGARNAQEGAKVPLGKQNAVATRCIAVATVSRKGGQCTKPGGSLK